MPKGIKSAPPQQASLSELWKAGAKKPKKEDAIKAEVPAEKDVEMADASEATKPGVDCTEILWPPAHHCNSAVQFSGRGEEGIQLCRETQRRWLVLHRISRISSNTEYEH